MLALVTLVLLCCVTGCGGLWGKFSTVPIYLQLIWSLYALPSLNLGSLSAVIVCA